MNIYVVYQIGTYIPVCIISASSFEEAMRVRGWDIIGDMNSFSVPRVYYLRKFYCTEAAFVENYYWDI